MGWILSTALRLSLLQQVQGLAGSGDGFAFFWSQLCELESVAIASLVPHDALHFDGSGGDGNGKLEGDGGADVPARDKYPSHSSLVDIQRAAAHLAVFRAENADSQFGFEFVSWEAAAVDGAFGLLGMIHRAIIIFTLREALVAAFVELFGNWNSLRDVLASRKRIRIVGALLGCSHSLSRDGNRLFFSLKLLQNHRTELRDAAGAQGQDHVSVMCCGDDCFRD